MTRTYRYVPHPKVADYIRAGWVLSSALDGSSHGQWSALMWHCGGECCG